MKFVLIACLCIFALAVSTLLIALAIEILDGTDLTDAIVERIRGKE